MKHLVTSLVVLGALAAPAHADKADKLFEKAKKLQADKRFAEACPTYEEMDRTDPAIGAKLFVAKCYEDWGKLATAYKWYAEADKLATDAKDVRGPKIKEAMADLDTNVPRMTIKTPDGADPDVLDTLTLDGKPIPEDFLNSEQRVDPGPHVIEFTVDGQKKKKMAPVERGGESELSLDIPKGVGKKPRPPKKKDGVAPPVIVQPADPGKKQKIIAGVVGGVGVVALGISIGLSASAKGDYDTALADHCMGSTSMCDPTGVRITHDARHKANIMTAVGIGGLVAIGIGTYLFLTAPKAQPMETQALYIAPTLDASGGGVVVGGAF